MTQFNNELYAGFLPEAGDARFEGKRGFYPAMTAEEYRALPLPMKCATWDARVQYVIFDSYFGDYELSGKVEVHAENAFKALFRHSETDAQLYSVCAVRLFDGTLEEVHQPTAVLLPSSGTVAEYVPNAAEVEALAKLIYGEAGDRSFYDGASGGCMVRSEPR